jgi:hypothetical protein
MSFISKYLQSFLQHILLSKGCSMFVDIHRCVLDESCDKHHFVRSIFNNLLFIWFDFCATRLWQYSSCLSSSLASDTFLFLYLHVQLATHVVLSCSTGQLVLVDLLTSLVCESDSGLDITAVPLSLLFLFCLERHVRFCLVLDVGWDCPLLLRLCLGLPGHLR